MFAIPETHDLVLVGASVGLSQIPAVTTWFAAKVSAVKHKLAVAEAAIKADAAKADAAVKSVEATVKSVI